MQGVGQVGVPRAILGDQPRMYNVGSVSYRWQGHQSKARGLVELQRLSKSNRLIATIAAVVVALLAAWMGKVNGGYFVGDWPLAVFAAAGLVLISSMIGRFGGTRTWWSTLAVGFFAAYTAWALVSGFWSSNQGEAWLSVGQTLLYLLVFWLMLSLIVSGASRRWVLIASVAGPALVALFTLVSLTARVGDLFENGRLSGRTGGCLGPWDITTARPLSCSSPSG